MAYIPTLNALQLYQEAVFMTPAAVDIEPAGITNFRITPKVEVEQLKDKRPSTMPAEYSFVKKRWSEGVIEGYLDYNRAMLWFDGMFGYDGTSPHTYLSTQAAAVTPRGLTAVYGQTGLIYQVAGIVPSSLNISASSGEPWKFAYNFFALAATDGASLVALTTDVPELVHGYETALYMDEDLDSTIGTTARADIAFSFEANITANHAPIYHLGDQAWDSVRQGKWGGSLKLVVEADATALDTLGDIIDAANTGKGLTIRMQATDGTNTLKLDFCGIAQQAPNLITDTEGVVTIEFDLVPQYNSVYGGCWGAELTIA
jgi:hypothetical protein